MNCKLKLHSKGFYYQIYGAVTVLKFLQTLGLDFLHISPQFFPGKFLQANVQKILKVVLMHVAACNDLKFFQRNR